MLWLSQDLASLSSSKHKKASLMRNRFSDRTTKQNQESDDTKTWVKLYATHAMQDRHLMSNKSFRIMRNHQVGEQRGPSSGTDWLHTGDRSPDCLGPKFPAATEQSKTRKCKAEQAEEVGAGYSKFISLHPWQIKHTTAMVTVDRENPTFVMSKVYLTDV